MKTQTTIHDTTPTARIRLSLALFGALLAAGCDDPEDFDETDEILENLVAAGFAEDDLEIREGTAIGTELEGGGYAFGEPEMQVLVGGDVHVTLDASREIANVDTQGFRHWRTPNLVNQNTKVCLAKLKLPAAYATAVDQAVANYNALGLSLTFESGVATVSGCPNIPPGTPLPPGYTCGVATHTMTGCNSTIWVQYSTTNDPLKLGLAGFPSNGKAYPYIYLYNNLDAAAAAAKLHVVTHELGHTIGLRHTDWQLTNSCKVPGIEAQDGASQIAGTPAQTTNSIMAACVPKGTDGLFRGSDAAALNTLY